MNINFDVTALLHFANMKSTISDKVNDHEWKVIVSQGPPPFLRSKCYSIFSSKVTRQNLGRERQRQDNTRRHDDGCRICGGCAGSEGLVLPGDAHTGMKNLVLQLTNDAIHGFGIVANIIIVIQTVSNGAFLLKSLDL